MTAFIKTFGYKIFIVLSLCVLITLNYGLQVLMPFYSVGVQPRTAYGLIGIITSPFFHGNRYHLMGNLSIFWLIGILFYMKHSISKSTLILLAITLLEGGLVWCFGRNANHIGLSGVIFGIFGYMMANLILCWSWKSIGKLLISGLAMYYYAFLMPQLFNFQQGISFEGHIAGFLSGILIAKIMISLDNKQEGKTT